MELPRREPNDVHLPDGTFQNTLERLRQFRSFHDLRIGIVNAFDFRTRMLPYWYADTRMAPCSVRTIGDTLHAAGFKHLRIILQQWTPNFRPSLSKLDGQPLDILLVSAMQVHAEPAYDLVRDAHRMGSSRPLVLAGGPKAIYEPTDYFELGPQPGIGADCVITGEVFVLLQLLETILDNTAAGASPRTGFERARTEGLLAGVNGLVYLSPHSTPQQRVAINTGVQRLLRNLDEMPMPDAGYRMLEPPHRGKALRPQPLPQEKVRSHSPIASIIATQGCKFCCSFCPIPAFNQRTWRHKSPQRFAAEIKHLHETFGIRYFFGTDDNFFNKRDSVIRMMTELSQTDSGGARLGRKIHFYTEATQADVYKNQDILPLCRKAGLRGIWFGIEDITGDLVNKGQSATKVSELFKLLNHVGIQPMVMMIHSDEQPLRSKPGDLSGLLNQARYVFDKGAVSYQCTYLGPAVGARDFEPAASSGNMFHAVGTEPVPQAFQDGNHIVSSRHSQPWRRQINLLMTYACFYNPVNLLRTLIGLQRNSVSGRRVAFQIIGHIGLMMTLPKMLKWAWRLKRGPIARCHAVPPARIPMVDARTGQEVNWGIKHPPSLHLPPCAKKAADPAENVALSSRPAPSAEKETAPQR